VGVGTLTFVTQDGEDYGGLGHQIFDSEQNKEAFTFGTLYASEIIGVVRGEEGKAGQLRGTVDRTKKIGTVATNSYCGVYGTAETIMHDQRPLISIGDKEDVKTGKAYIYTTLSGTSPKKYEIEIVKAVKQDVDADKGMVIHVTDERLLEATGGIVQGMSGSPIVQNGKIIGAVTHVFVSDPTRGYGIYINTMLNKCSE
ncbi:MAG: SpoIVB peptidase S55 domain-containing protein, partial [Bacillota bacterium]